MSSDHEIDQTAAQTGSKINNRVREMRVDEGIPRARLASLSGISDKTLHDIEKGVREGSDVTKARIVNGFNKIVGKKRDYTFASLFL